MRIRNILAAALALAALFNASASNEFPRGDRWTIHSAAGVTPRQMIDTGDGVYYLAHQHIFNNSTSFCRGFYANPSGGLFYYDKSNPERGFADVQKMYDLHGADIWYVKYNPLYKYLVVAYLDGGIDFVDHNGKVTYVDALKDSRVPGSKTITNVTFDINTADAWISTQMGYLRVDGNDFSVKNMAMWSTPVNSICRVGDKVIAIINGLLYEADANATLNLQASFTAIEGITHYDAASLMPVSDTGFAFLDSGGSTYGRLVMLADYQDGAWSAKQLYTDTGIAQTDTKLQGSTPVQHTAIPNRDGYLVASKNNLYFIKRAEGDNAPGYSTLKAPSGTASFFLSSWDGTEVWASDGVRGLQGKKLKEGTTNQWTDLTEVLMADGPGTCMDSKFAYSPTGGLIFASQHPFHKEQISNAVYPLLISAYRDGKWVDLSTRFVTPYKAEEDATFMTNYKRYLDNLPIKEGNGLFVDPLYPDYAYVGCLFNGSLAVINVRDPKEFPLLFHQPKEGDISNLLPGKAMFPNLGWSQYSGVCAAGADADGNVWITRDNWSRTDIDPKIADLWCWTPEDRKEALETGDVKKGGDWKNMSVYTGEEGFVYPRSLALKHPKNKNKVVLYNSGGLRSMQIYDHKGTLDNPNDDEVKSFKNVRTPSGATAVFGYLNAFLENPVTGDVVVCSENDTFIIDPSESVTQDIAGGVITGELLHTVDANGMKTSVAASVSTSDACFDEYGRLWVAMKGGGVIGISADGREVFARYTEQNSPIPSDNVYAVGWNPDTKSLFMSTDHGLAEVRPDLPLEVEPLNTQLPFVTPSVVNTDYSGVVAVHNVSTNTRMRVRDAEGLAVCDLPVPADGMTFWNLCDLEGKRVKSGRYIIYDVNIRSNAFEVVVE